MLIDVSPECQPPLWLIARLTLPTENQNLLTFTYPWVEVEPKRSQVTRPEGRQGHTLHWYHLIYLSAYLCAHDGSWYVGPRERHCAYVHAYACMRVHMCIFVWECACMLFYACAAYLHMCVRTPIRACIQVYTRVTVRACMHVCMYIHI